MAKKQRSAKPIHTTMGPMISSTKPSRSMVEKKYPLKSSTHGETDTYASRPKKR